jgi:hypothetical protein
MHVTNYRIPMRHEYPLPLRERVRVRGQINFQAPSPHSSPLKGEEALNSPAVRESTKVLSLSVASSLALSLINLIFFYAIITSVPGLAWAAEATRFLASYGGTAGYQLPL